MANSKMKLSDVQAIARESAHEAMSLSNFPVELHQIGPDEYAFVATVLEDGTPVFYSFKGAVKRYNSTDKVQAFNVDAAVADYEEEKKEAERKANVKAEEKARKLAKKTSKPATPPAENAE